MIGFVAPDTSLTCILCPNTGIWDRLSCTISPTKHHVRAGWSMPASSNMVYDNLFSDASTWTHTCSLASLRSVQCCIRSRVRSVCMVSEGLSDTRLRTLCGLHEVTVLHLIELSDTHTHTHTRTNVCTCRSLC